MFSSRYLHDHDCPNCRFLGGFVDEKAGQTFDVYSCRADKTWFCPSIVIKMGDECWNYESIPVNIWLDNLNRDTSVPTSHDLHSIGTPAMNAATRVLLQVGLNALKYQA